MNLVLPGVGTEGSPEYAEEVNNDLTIIDSHSHLPGSGVPITTSALNIDADLSLNSFNLTAVRSVRMNTQGSPLVEPLDLTCVYVSGADLYYNDASGTPVRITQNGAVAGTPGSIANLVAPASAAYVAANDSFLWESDVNTPAAMDNGPVTIRELVASGKGVTLQTPTALAADYTLTLPLVPANQSFMAIDNSGNISAFANISQGITLPMLALALQQAFCPAGSILAFGGTSAPNGFLMCDGSAVSRVTYLNLFNVIGTSFGQGDGVPVTGTFNTPDLRGQFLRGVTGASSQDPDATSRTAMATGGNTGNNVGSVQGNAFQTHNHSITGSTGGSVGSNLGAGGTLTAQSSNFIYNLTIDNAAATGGTSQASANETRPTNAYVNFIIKT